MIGYDLIKYCLLVKNLKITPEISQNKRMRGLNEKGFFLVKKIAQ